MNKLKSIEHLVRSAKFSLKGLSVAWSEEMAFRQEIVVLLIAIIFNFYYECTVIEHILLISSLVMILIVELLNSAIETITDRISLEPHPLSGRAKDMGSAAVLISILLALFIWSMILFF